MPFKDPEERRSYFQKYAAKRKEDPLFRKARAAATARYRKKNPDAWIQRYGITQNEFTELCLKQGGVCAICGMPPSDRWKRLQIDHDHGSGKLRGLLCHKCNTGIGFFRDLASLCRKAADYLEMERVSAPVCQPFLLNQVPYGR